jgi:hypothetical protein
MLYTIAFHSLDFEWKMVTFIQRLLKTGTPLTTEESQHLREEVLNTAQYFTERMIDYIRNNTSLFPEYSTNSGADVNPDKNAYYNGMNLERPNQQGTRLTLQNFLTPGLN